MSTLHFILSFVFAYLLGSIPFGYVLGRVFYHKNLLIEGSGNIGTTNTFRVLGPTAGFLTFVLDSLKGTAATLMGVIWGPLPVHWWLLIFGLAGIIGHTFSIWIGFRGGKAVATSFGMLIAYAPVLSLEALLIFLTLIFLTSMVSVASIFGFILVTILTLFMGDWFLFGLALILTIFVVYRHRGNIKRIRRGKESLVPFGLFYWSQHKRK